MLREWHLAQGYSEQGSQEGCEMLIMTFTVTFSCDFLRRVKTTETERWGYVRSFPLIKLWLHQATARGQFLFPVVKKWRGGGGGGRGPHTLNSQGCRVDWLLQYLSFNQSSQGRDSWQSCWSVFAPDKESLLFLISTGEPKQLIIINKMNSNCTLWMFYHCQIAYYYVQMCFGNYGFAH